MLMLSEPELWWNTMPGPSNLVEQVAELLLQPQNVVIRYGEGMPWESDFRISVKEKVQQRDPNILLDAYSAPPQCDLGRWVAKQIGGSEFFCLPSEDPIRKATEQNLLRDRVLWVSGIQTRRQAEGWFDLAARMSRSPKEQRGRMVALVPSSIPVNEAQNALNIAEYVGDYDLHFFSESLTSRLSLPRTDKKYLAELAVTLAQGDPRRCAQYVAMGQELVEHPEAQTQNMNHDDRHHAIWLAQMRVVFARIEETKFDILQRNWKAVSVLVGTSDDFGNYIADIGDIELRHLVFAVKNHQLVLPEEDLKTAQLLHANRNQLAHHHILSYQELEEVGERLL